MEPMVAQQMTDQIVQYEANLAQAEARRQIEQSVSRYKDELLTHCKSWLSMAKSFRKDQELKWQRWQRLADSQYDPALKASKESWQSKVVIPVVASHRERAKAALVRMLLGVNPPLSIRDNLGLPDAASQCENIRDLTMREASRSGLKSQFDLAEDEASTFGDGFMRVRYEVKTEPRRVRVPVSRPDLANPEMAAAATAGIQPVTDIEEQLQDVEVYRGVKAEYVSIWDIFPDPKALDIPGNPIAHRFRIPFGQLVSWNAQGLCYDDALDLLEDVSGGESHEEDAASKADRGINDLTPERTKYAKKLECFEFFARLPAKWVTFGLDGGDPEQLISARVIFHINALIWVEPARDYDGEPPIYKLPYMRVAGSFYDRGIPEMIGDLNDLINETVSQRVDNVGLILNRGVAVIEKAVSNPDDLVSKPGWTVKLNGQYIGQDVRNGIMPFDFPDVTASSYSDVTEAERYCQERTSVNRMTLGTAGLVKDANQTLGGMNIMQQATNDQLAYIGSVQEEAFLIPVWKAIWKQLYMNLRPEDVIRELGPERAMGFRLISPEEIDRDMTYEPQGVFTMENKAMQQGALQAQFQQFQPYPWINPMAYHDKLAKLKNLDPEGLKYTPEEMQQMMMANQMMQQAQQPIQEPRPTTPGQEQGTGKPGK